jgi:hypothetical protein
MERSPECRDVERCLKEFNPEHFPGLYWGTPWEYRDFLGCCVDCQVEKRMKDERIKSVSKEDSGESKEEE